MNAAVIGVNGANTLVLKPGAMLRLRDVDNLRVMATKKGLVLRAGDNGRRALKLVWQSPKAAAKGGAQAGAAGVKAKAAAAAANAASSKALAASANKMTAAADSLSRTAKAMTAAQAASPTATAVKVAATGAKATGAGAAKVAATGAGLGLGLGLGALGPALLAGGALVIGGIYVYRRSRRDERPPEY